jgi:hypothetical protein
MLKSQNEKKVNRNGELCISSTPSLTSAWRELFPQLSPSNYFFILSGSTIKKPFKQSDMFKRFRCAVVILTTVKYHFKQVKSNIAVQIKKRLSEAESFRKELLRTSRHFGQLIERGCREQCCVIARLRLLTFNLRTEKCPRQRYLAVSLG